MNPVDFYKALADQTRLALLLLLEQETELCVNELVAALSSSQPKISRHLALLRQTGLLSVRKQKQWVYYRLNSSLPTWCVEVLKVSAQHNELFMQPFNDNLHAMRDGQVCCP